MPDKVRAGLLPCIISIFWVWIACAGYDSTYGSAEHTNGEIHDDKEKDKQYNRSNYTF
jgi:hypothetical protein